MPVYEFGTSNAYTNCEVTYNTSILGNYPNVVFRFTYSVRIHITGIGSWNINGCTFNFHTNQHTFNLNMSTGGQMGGYSGVVVTGTLDLPFGTGQSCTHTPGVGVNASGLWSGNGLITATQTIPRPNVYECNNPREITPFTALVDYEMSPNSCNYWRCRIVDTISGKTWTPSNDTSVSGSITLTDLTPETNYKVTVQFIDRSNNVILTGGVFAEFITLVDQAKAYIKIDDWQHGKVFIKLDGAWQKAKRLSIKQSNSWKDST